MIPKYMWGFSYIVPILPLIPIFYWGRLQTGEISYCFVAVIGIITDAVNATPLGMSALLYLVFTAFVRSQSKYIHKEGFVVIWWYFVTLLGIICGMQWVVMSMFGGKLYAFIPAFFQVVVTACIYPLFHRIFDFVFEYIKQRRWVLAHG